MMAEFQKVMEQFNRMCGHYHRECYCPIGCPMNGVNISQCRKIAFERPKETEKTVMAWAAEHPEPVYPTWCEWLVTQGVIGGTKETGHFVKDELFKLIPADIAQKLGIEPKGG